MPDEQQPDEQQPDEQQPDEQQPDEQQPDDGERDRDEVIDVPVEESIDLHTFAPGEAREVVLAYLDAALERGFGEVRIVHGKGQGVLRRIVHGVLERHPEVLRFSLATDGGGNWGATVAVLRQRRPRR